MSARAHHGLQEELQKDCTLTTVQKLKNKQIKKTVFFFGCFFTTNQTKYSSFSSLVVFAQL
jgi:hypothetical protein